MFSANRHKRDLNTNKRERGREKRVVASSSSFSERGRDFFNTEDVQKKKHHHKREMASSTIPNNVNYSLASSFSTGIQSSFVNATTTTRDDLIRALPTKTLYSLPRLNAKTGEIETKLYFRNDETYENVLIGQALPGLAIAFLLFSMIVVAMVLKSVQCVFSLCCSPCERMFKPFPYTRSALRQTKTVMVCFALLGAIGCFIVFSCGNVLTEELTEAADSVRDIMVKLEIETYPSIEASLQQSIDEGVFVSSSDALQEIREEVAYAKDMAKEYGDTISTNAKMAERASLGLTSVLFIVSSITTIAIVGGNWRVIVFCSIFLTQALLLTWIVFGGVSALGVALDDAHFTVNEYLTSPKNVDVSAIVTCADASTSLKVVNELRAATYFTIKSANEKMIQIDPYYVMKAENASVRLLNAMFRPELTSTLCASAASDTRTGTAGNIVEIEGDGEEVDDDDHDSENSHSSHSNSSHSSHSSSSSRDDDAKNTKKQRRFQRRRELLHDKSTQTGRYDFTARSGETFTSFEETTCDFYRHNSSSVEEITYVKTDEPGYVDDSSAYYLDTNVYDFETKYTRCASEASTETTEFAARCFLVESSNDPWIPYDTYDAVEANVKLARDLIESLPKAHSLVTCEYLWADPNKDKPKKEREAAELTGLRKTEDRLQSSVKTATLMWTGVFMTGIAFFCMWIILMVAVHRLRHEDLMIDGDSFDPEKAGYEI